MKSMNRLDVLDLGLLEYGAALRLQDSYAAEISQGARLPTLLLLEHPHVYTFGAAGHEENLLWSAEQRRARGVAVHWVDRGGDVTYHGPGQLVGYPLIPLGQVMAGPSEPSSEALPVVQVPRADYVGYVRKLERVLIGALVELGVAAAQIRGLTGVWVQADVHSRCPRCRPEDRQKPAKIAAIGVKIDARGVSRHGFALNVDPDMTYWDGIVACGLADHPIVSIADLVQSPPEMARVKHLVEASFRETFGFDLA